HGKRKAPLAVVQRPTHERRSGRHRQEMEPVRHPDDLPHRPQGRDSTQVGRRRPRESHRPSGGKAGPRGRDKGEVRMTETLFGGVGYQRAAIKDEGVIGFTPPSVSITRPASAKATCTTWFATIPAPAP